jgi:NAD(P)-dependent dehydrogenase (short-subunit alcohol dehydrogenase family)
MNTQRAKTWLITGVSTGLGKSLAEAALKRGDVVIGTLRSDDACAAFESSAPGRALAVKLDLTDHASVRDGVADAERRAGGIDVLIHNAGYGLVAGVEEAGADEIRAQFEVNVFGAVAVLQAVLPFMRARKAGRIVAITSVSGLVGWPSLGIYSGSKFALEGICETLAMELEPLGIKVIMIEPGGLKTDFATRSRVQSLRRIADYDATVGACRRILDEHAGHEPGDPVAAAAAILDVAVSESPPLRLLLGSDALGYANKKLETQLDEIRAWEKVSRTSDFA